MAVKSSTGALDLQLTIQHSGAVGTVVVFA